MSKYLIELHKQYILSKQILKSGTSIGANIFEALEAQGKKDFVAKMYVSLKESSETMYWLIILKETEYITHEMYDSLNKDCKELHRILTKIIKTTKESMK